jgi:uncharacterized phage protein (TIGR02220 family)
MAKSPHFQFYANDYLSDIIFLSDSEVSDYSKLLCITWVKDNLKVSECLKIIPNLHVLLEKLEHRFFILDDIIHCNWHEKTNKFREKQIENVNKRWKKDTKLIPNLYQNDTKHDTKHDTKTIPLEVEEEVYSIKNKEEEYIQDIKYKKGIEIFKNQSIEILEHFNLICEKRIDVQNQSHQKFVIDRLKEKYEPNILKNIIELKNHEWKNSDMEKYLTIDTLFNKTKCLKYSEQVNEIKSNPSKINNYGKSTTKIVKSSFGD